LTSRRAPYRSDRIQPQASSKALLSPAWTANY
jgi:hypothetical protein